MTQIPLNIDHRLWVPLDLLPKEALAAAHAAFTHKNPVWHKQRSMGYRSSEKPTIKTWAHEQRGDDPTWWLSMPRGGLQRVRTLMHEHGLGLHITDNRTKGSNLGAYDGNWVDGRVFPEHAVTLWNHQDRIVEAVHARQNCCIRAPTGSGKTTALLAAVAREQLPTIIIVWDSKLFKQWQERITAELGIPTRDIGVVRGKVRKYKPITLAMQQTLKNFDDDDWATILPLFGFVACDEVQRYSAGTFQGSIDRFPAKFRVGVSADESRPDKKEFLIYDMFGGVAVDVKKRELETKGIIHSVEVRIIPTDFENEKYVRQKLAKGKVPDFNALLDAMTNDERRNSLIHRSLLSVARTDPTFVFSHRVKHALAIDHALVTSPINSGLLVGGEDNVDEFERTKERLRSGELNVGVGTYKAIGIGLDVPNVAVGLCATPIHSNRQFMDQVKGRICRKSSGKMRAIMYYLWDRYVYGFQPLRNLRRWNRRVLVLDGGDWIHVDDYMERHPNERHPKADHAALAGIFAGR